MLIGISILTFCLLVLFIWACYNNEIIAIISGCILLFGGLICYGIVFTTTVEKTKEVKSHVSEIVRGKHITVVSTDNNHCQIYRGYESEKITDSTEFYWILKYNYYGVQMSDSDFIYK